MNKKELIAVTFPGCAAKLPRGKCRYHVKTPLVGECFNTKEALMNRVAPMRKGSPDFIREDKDPIAFAILRLSLDAHDMRGEYPIEPPELFEREFRVFEGYEHYGWTPVWASGEKYEGWSYRKGFLNDPQWARFKSAARQEVAEQIEEIRYGCGIPGAHIHHAAPWHFKELLNAFVEMEGGDWRSVALREYGLAYFFADDDFAARWRDFHMTHATLVALTAEQHWEAHRNEASGLTWDGQPMATAAE